MHTASTGHGVPFVKMQGAGNDYIFIDGFATTLPADLPRLAQVVSCRRKHVGADGLVCLLPPGRENRDVELRIWNADGSAARMCGTAARCAAVWMLRKQRIENSCRILIGDRIVTATGVSCDGWTGNATVNMGPPRLLSPPAGEPLPVSPMLTPSADLSGTLPAAVGGHSECNEPTDGIQLVHRVDMGNPHVVVFCDEISDQMVRIRGPRLEHHPALPEPTNVEFAAVRDHRTVDVRVWERGSGETLSCGSGACAVFAAALAAGRMPGPACSVRFPGGTLEVTRMDSGPLLLTGSVEISCIGELAGL